VAEVSETASAEDWTCTVRLAGGGLPDVPRLERHVRTMGVGATLRGVEADVEGELEAEGNTARVRLGGSGQVVELAPNTRSIYWHAARERPRKLREREREAFTRLLAASRKRSGRIRVLGPLSGSPAEGLRLEVRDYRWLPGPGAPS